MICTQLSKHIFLPRCSHKGRINAILCFGSAVAHHHLDRAICSGSAELCDIHLLLRINLHVPILVVASPWFNDASSIQAPCERLVTLSWTICSTDLFVHLYAIQLSNYASTHPYGIFFHDVSVWWVAHSKLKNSKAKIWKYDETRSAAKSRKIKNVEKPTCRRKSSKKTNFQNC